MDVEKNKQVLTDLERVVRLIKTDTKDISETEKKQMIEETVEHFDNFVSPGW